MTRFLLSNRNMAGCGGALLVLALYLVGVIDAYWYALAALGYGIGYVAIPQPVVAHCPEGLGSTDTLNWLESKALPQINGEAHNLLRNILTVAKELMPRLKELETQGMVQAENRSKLKQLLNNYLPSVLEGYLKLPSLYAKSARVAGGKTAQVLLVEQLQLLDGHVMELRDSVYSENINGLLASGQFLKEKFDKSFVVIR